MLQGFFFSEDTRERAFNRKKTRDKKCLINKHIVYSDAPLPDI